MISPLLRIIFSLINYAVFFYVATLTESMLDMLIFGIFIGYFVCQIFNDTIELCLAIRKNSNK